MEIDIIAFGAHPDDVELGCGGTLARLTRDGYRVVIVDLTRGEMGSRGTPDIRAMEAAEAARQIGVHDRINLGLPDTRLSNTREHQIELIRQIRHFRPHTCLINAQGDRHPDHNDASRLVIDSVFYSGLAGIRTGSDQDDRQAPHRPAHLLFYMLHRSFEPDFVFDISETFDLKKKAISAYKSQFNVEDPGEEPETFISDPGFFRTLEARATLYGYGSGFRYGEPFQYAEKPIPLRSLELFEANRPRR